jgi:type I restriction enzyme, S subunit
MTFPRYPRYKDSGVEWLGEVPEHWVVMPLARVTLARCDGPFGSGLKSDHYTNSGVRVVRLQNIRRAGFNGSDEAFIDEAYYQSELQRHEVRAGDLLVAGLGDETKSVGRACVAPAGIEPAIVKADCFRFRLRVDEVLPDFVALQLTAGSESDAGILSTGSTRSRISLSAMASRKIALGPVSEQRAITSFLSREVAKIDALVAEQECLVELLQAKRLAITSHAVTRGLDPHARMKRSGVEWLGDVPAHWEIVRLATVFHEVVEPGSDDLPILTVSIHTGVSDREISDEEMDRKVSRSDDRSKYKKVEPGDLVYNMMRAWQGGFGTVAVRGMVSPAYVVARPRRQVATRYVEHLLRTPAAVEQMRRQSRGVTDFRLRLYWDEFKNLRIALPPDQESLRICDMIEAMDDEYASVSAAAREAISLLQERRAALISAAVTGKIDVRGLAEAS